MDAKISLYTYLCVNTLYFMTENIGIIGLGTLGQTLPHRFLQRDSEPWLSRPILRA